MSDLPSDSAAVSRKTTDAPALRMMPWLAAGAAIALYAGERLSAFSYTAMQFGVLSREAQRFSDLPPLPNHLLYSHLLWTMAQFARALGAEKPGTLGIAQMLSALGAGAAAGLFFWRLKAIVFDWGIALLAACLAGASFAVWFAAIEGAPQALALALGLASLALAWPAAGRPSAWTLAGAGLLAAAAACLDAGAALWIAPLGAAAALGSTPKQAAARALALAGSACLALALAYSIMGALAIRAGHTPGYGAWLSLLAPVRADEPAGAAMRAFAYFKSFKYALVYRAPWIAAIPFTLVFFGLPGAWRVHRGPVLVFGLWAAGGALRALFADMADTDVWALAMPGVAGLFACSLDSALRPSGRRRFLKPAMLAGVLQAFLFIGCIHGWLPRFEKVEAYPAYRQAVERLARESANSADLIVAPSGYFSLIFRYETGRWSAVDSAGFRASAAERGETPDAAARRMIRAALERGGAVFAPEELFDETSAMFVHSGFWPGLAGQLRQALPGEGAPVDGIEPPLRFLAWKS
ncbi:MAG: hypothetical protein BWZ10_00813 [candidate division BRC1 bacterium ADurb.BinA364]|nr:MAG: hypothetical protein BWZ10_00813 [candidate division BRC1 bacterium ADurb.BinA364]